jgi:uncharacterized protein involved in outer membrane biogenesis
MGKLFRVVLAIVGVVVLAVAGVVIYAIVNLNSIVQSRRDLILARASDALGRKVDVQNIHASLGWGVVADLQGLTVADDPDFSQAPFVQASDVYARVALLPLLSRRLEVHRISLKQPVVHLIRNQRGELNVSTIGKKTAESAPKMMVTPQGVPSGPAGGAPLALPSSQGPVSKGAGALENVSISSFTIDNGTIDYREPGKAPVALGALNLDLENVGVATPIDIKLDMAAFGSTKNVSLNGKIGPLMGNGGIDMNAIPIALELDAGPVTLAQLKSVPQIASALPPQIEVTNPVSAHVKLDGTTQDVAFNAASDLTGNQVVYSGVLDKPAGVPFRFSADGTRKMAGGAAQVAIQTATLILADLNLKAAQIQLGPNPSARLDSNRFNLASIAKMLVALSKYNASGNAEIHTAVKIIQKRPELNGTVTLASVTVTPPGKRAIVGGLSGDIRMAGNSAAAGPLSFDIGSGHGRLSINAQSIQPINANYDFSADVLKPAELTANPKPDNADDHLDKLAVKGSVRGELAAPNVTAALTSPDGTLQNVAYRNLAVDALYGRQTLTVNSFKLAAFEGGLDGNARAALGADPVFNVGLNLHDIKLREVLLSQKSRAADIVQGRLTGQVRVAGRGNTFDQIKPTLNGNGQMAVANGKLVGVNIGADAMRKVQGLPGIDSLITPSIVARHPALFNSPDTNFQQLGMTFTIEGPRVISHDIKAMTADYSALGDGWFDLNKNIDVKAHILLSSELSRELMSEKKNVIYIANEQRQVDIPVSIRGQLPKPSVQPDIQSMAQRAANHLVQKKAGKLLDKYLGGKNSGPGNNNNLGNALNRLFR